MTERKPPSKQNIIDAVIFMGASLYIPGRKLDDFNPYSDIPGQMVFRKAFAYGWNNSRQVLWEHDFPGQPIPPPNSLLW